MRRLGDDTNVLLFFRLLRAGTLFTEGFEEPTTFALDIWRIRGVSGLQWIPCRLEK
jgi:hypothetical protein